MTIAPTPSRDTRIDVIRALALLSIFINHVPGNPFEALTHKNFGFSDAAEAFVLLAGMSAAFAYGLKFRIGNRLVTALKMWRRAGVLYIAQLGTTMGTLAIFSFFALHYARPELLEKINIGPVIEKTPQALIGLATLGHQLGYNNILSMYAGVLLLLPLLVLVGSYSLRSMVALSGLVWLVAGIWRVAPPHYPNDGVWFLNPLSWQFLFVIGMAVMMHIRRGGRIPVHSGLVWGAACYLAISLLWVRGSMWHIDISLGLPTVLTGFDKTFLSLPRLAHVLAAAYLIAVVPGLSNLARTRETGALAVLGRHALPVFVTGTLLSMVAQAYRLSIEVGLVADAAIILAGIAAQFALAYYLDWYGRLTRGQPTPQPVAAERPKIVLPAATSRPLVSAKKPELV